MLSKQRVFGALLAVAGLVGLGQVAEAQWHGGRAPRQAMRGEYRVYQPQPYYGYQQWQTLRPQPLPHQGHREPIYHAPEVHLDNVYHHDYWHWTPGQGIHSHGHHDQVPHYVPGHADEMHDGHVDVNPNYHH